MQPMMLVDFLDGSRVNQKFLFMYGFAQVSRACKIKIVDYDKELDCFAYDVEWDNEDLNHRAEEMQLSLDVVNIEPIHAIFEHSIHLMKEDTSARAFCISYTHYLENGCKNYLVTKDLTETFKNSRFSLKGKHLKEGESGFIEFRDKKVKYYDESPSGVFYSIQFYAGIKILNVSTIMNDGAFCYFNIGVKDDESIEQAFRERIKPDTEKDGKIEQREGFKTLYMSSKDSKCDYDFMRIVVATIIYIGGKNSDLVFESNTFSSKKSKLETEKKMFTSKNWCLVGKGFRKIEANYVQGLVPVVGHFKFVEVGTRGAGQYEYRWWSDTTRNQKLRKTE